ncbi:queuosine precursor transporter [Nocardia cyriacigeorgica]|uniref:queuosine precursor transporter n=1 Tax=Nocardia cyriacigeorgica TaxID=135487 RepID=UPI0013CFAD5C|nr:queuosine precursor transporter [Nocardia cyriacigeorgica]MBF6438061.1 queuosine precursor transporter [Nocardia cyriacigeorgica]MBF6453596.1 queuosine precursor transporter [Nocardia cyriacigeorgica]MBF6478610.1 queuosine precursor transporter [Nocardia cyriacigeorgica]MBF6550764.1 queuosine precursor transporter [Nocardia cyriacigeorgica]NEW27447.1 queuosine precursor transporter [Nocardia cyriacigeorgica]
MSRVSDSNKPADHEGSGRPASNHAAFAQVARGYYTPIVALFTATLIISNVCATKGVQFFSDKSVTLGPLEVLPISTDGAFFLFPLAYILGDVLSEVYGFRATRRAIYYGFAALLLMVVCFAIAIQLPPAVFYENQEAFRTVLGTTPQLVAAGLAGYFVGQLLNSATLVLIKERTKEKHLWARLIGSTVVGEFADTLIFCSIAATAIGIDSWQQFINYLIVGFLWKTLIEVLLLPITYRIIAVLKKHEPSYAPAGSDPLHG